MPRIPSVKALARERHTISRRLERRERWLEKSGVSIETFRRAVQKLVDLLDAKKLVPAVRDKRGTVIEMQQVDDTAVQEKAARDLAALHVRVIGLEAHPDDAPKTAVQFVFNVPAWMESLPQAGVQAIEAAESVAVAQITDGQDSHDEEVVEQS